MSTEPDAAQEFAERVSAKFWEGFNSSDPAFTNLSNLIANELRAGGWQKGGGPEGVDMTRATFT